MRTEGEGGEKKRERESERKREGQETPLCKQKTVLHMLIAAWTTWSISARISPGGELTADWMVMKIYCETVG